ncbi:hypothetical protein BDV97DRAFT_339789 [Delphinella strobiligena]|nr:hypothetical protein BDV97DRAFT_339789 [Delphinella strobiligena]
MVPDLYVRETWAWYILGIIIISTRYVVRLRKVGIKGFQGDDYMTLGVVLCFTIDATVATIVSQTGGTNLEVFEAADMVPSLTTSQIERYALGSKWEFVACFSYPGLIWCTKFAVLFFYKRLTYGSLHIMLVIHHFWICGAAYVGVILTAFLGCRPLHLNWQVVPIPPSQCTLRRQLCIVIAVLNILTDTAILAIPFPMLWRLKMPLKRKIMVSILLSSGIFVITAAIIRVVYSLDSHPSAANVDRWGTRETIIGIFATNVPIIRPLFTRAFWTRGTYNPQSSSSKSGSQSWRGRRLEDSGGDVELGSTAIKISHPNRSNLQEEFTWIQEDAIYVQAKYDVQTHNRDDLSSRKAASWNEVRVTD